MPFPVRELIADRGLPVTARPDESVHDAYVRMRENDFSQLPVVAEDGRPIGVLTGGSILRAISYLGIPMTALHVREAMERKPDEYQADDDLFDLLDDLRDTYAVLIVDAAGKLTGIVTSYDTTEFFRRKAEDMMLVEDIESAVKDLIRSAYASPSGEPDEAALSTLVASMAGARQDRRKDAIKLVGRYLSASADPQGNNIKVNDSAFSAAFEKTFPAKSEQAFDDLNLGDYIQMFFDGGKWERFHEVLGVDREPLRNMFESVRKTRNSLAHFRGGLSSHESERLRFCGELLARAQQRLAAPRAADIAGAPRSPTPSPLPTPPANEAVELAAEAVQPEDSRYSRLALHLQSQPLRQVSIALRLEDIEKIIQGHLPDSARRHRSWWANDSQSHIQSRQWLDAGWRVSEIDLSEGRVTFERIREREQLYLAFNSALQDELHHKWPNIPLRAHRDVGVSWLWLIDLPVGRTALAHLGVSFALRGRFRVELYIDNGDVEDNKRLFDKLHSEQAAIEAEVSTALRWERLNDRRASRIAAYHSGAITDQPAKQYALREWAVTMVGRFYDSLVRRIP